MEKGSPDNIASLAETYINTTHKNLFLTGRAGTGKTTFLKEIINHTYKNTVVAAPTGIAAINAGGVTLHSLFQLPFGLFLPQNQPIEDVSQKINTPATLLSTIKLNSSKRKLLHELELLIIDEVSMLRADVLDAIDQVLRHVRRKKNRPFGGVQVLFIGDLLQLPPVVQPQEWHYLSRYYTSIYFFDAQVLRESPPIYIELEKVYRQSDPHFIELLNHLRDNHLTDDDRHILHSHYKKDFQTGQNDGYIHITTHNRQADQINQRELNRLPGKEKCYKATVKGQFDPHLFPNQEELILKTDAQVMFIKNDPSGAQNYFNGKIGRVASLDHDNLTISCDDGKEITLEPYIWENIRYVLNPDSLEIEEKIIGYFEQYPIRLAWAITVHKSQGLTFEKAVLDLSKTFAPGQMYVALSRLTSLEGLVLSAPLPQIAFESDQAISAFSTTKKERALLEKSLQHDTREHHLLFTQQAFDLDSLERSLHTHLKVYDESGEKSIRQPYKEWALELLTKTHEIRETADKFCHQIARIIAENPDSYLALLTDRVQKAKTYFDTQADSRLESINQQIKKLSATKKSKGFLKEVEELEHLFMKYKTQIKKALLVLQTAQEGRTPVRERIYLKDKTTEKIKKQKKADTRAVTLELYHQGKSIDEIAEERNLTTNTIMGHLALFVEKGTLNVGTFLDQEKLDNILTVQETVQSGEMRIIKEKLGEEYSYGDIRFALAHLRHLQSST